MASNVVYFLLFLIFLNDRISCNNQDLQEEAEYTMESDKKTVETELARNESKKAVKLSSFEGKENNTNLTIAGIKQTFPMIHFKQSVHEKRGNLSLFKPCIANKALWM